MKNSKTKTKFDNSLFGKVYSILKWNINCVCPYYLEWKISTRMIDVNQEELKIVSINKTIENRYKSLMEL